MLDYEYDEGMLFFPSFVFTASFLISLVFLARKQYSSFLIAFSLATAVAGFIITKERPSLKLTFNPFEILEMPTESAMFNDITDQDIKRAYRKLSLKWHPDRMQFNDNDTITVEEVHDKFTQINLAKQTLLDPLMRNNWEECGDPNGCSVGFASSMGLALPKWVITTYSPLVVLCYMVLLGLAIPFLLARWWYSTTIQTKDGVHTSVAKYVFKGFSEEITFHSLLFLISSSLINEPQILEITSKITEKDIDELETQVAEQLEVRGHKINKEVLEGDNKVVYLLYLLIHCQLLRIPIQCMPVSDSNVIIIAFYKVVAKTMLKIALARQWLSNVIACLDLSQLLVQGNWANDSSLFQLPHMTHSTLKILKNRRKSVKTITHVAETGDVANLFNMLDPNEITNVMKMLEQYPRLVLEGADFRVQGEKQITPSALVTCTIKIRSVSVLKSKEELKQEFETFKAEHQPDENEFENDVEEEDTFLVNMDDEEGAPIGHAPNFPQVIFNFSFR